jgi:hypothetical protein
MAERIRLPAILGSHPLAVLAAFGLLRLAADWSKAARLGFTIEDDWIGFIEMPNAVSIDTLIQKLTEWVQSKAVEHVIGWAEDVRVHPDEYRNKLADALAGDDLLLAQFLGALAADGAVDKQKGLVKPSDFYMVSGQQSFLGGAREILAQVRSKPASLFREALQGPWNYMTPLHSLGWDPNTERLYALRHRSPTSEKPSCVAGAILLALWALPLFPVVSKDGRARTVGFVSHDRAQYFSWPVFSAAIDVHELKSLIQAGKNEWTSGEGELRPGIEAVFESRRSEFGQGYAVFRTPQAIHRRRVVY